MKKYIRRFILFLSGFIFLLLVLAAIFFKPVDTTPYQQSGFYKNEIELIDSMVSNKSEHPNKNLENLNEAHSSNGRQITVGWSRLNLQPPFTTPIAIDAHRDGKHFEGVHDSIYVRAFVFKQGERKVAYISADLLIIPPSVTKIFDTILRAAGFDASNIFFTATHTHSSIGAWYNSYVGEKFAGKYDERVPRFIAATISTAILEAEKDCQKAKIGYAQFSTHQLVFNRLLKQMAHLPDSLGKTDSILRIVKIEKENGGKAAIITFSAHNTVFHESMMQLSGDWSGLMMQQLNASGKINFSSFSAGAVGSQGPFEFSKEQETEAVYMAEGISKIVLKNFDSIQTEYATTLEMIHMPLYLREPNLRVTNHFVLRPWLFRKLFEGGNIGFKAPVRDGDLSAVYLNEFVIGNIVFAGMPCDFSGELVQAIDSVAKLKNLNLLITSFNGNYTGYVTDDKWYCLNTYETRMMNWFGPGNGSYFSEVLKRILPGNKEVIR